MMVDFMDGRIDSSSRHQAIASRQFSMNLKGQLRFFLDLRGMTAAELSRKSGVSKQVLSIWLAGGQPKRIEQIKKVAALFR